MKLGYVGQADPMERLVLKDMAKVGRRIRAEPGIHLCLRTPFFNIGIYQRRIIYVGLQRGYRPHERLIEFSGFSDDLRIVDEAARADTKGGLGLLNSSDYEFEVWKCGHLVCPLRRPGQRAVYPPSMTSSEPVTNFASSDAR